MKIVAIIACVCVLAVQGHDSYFPWGGGNQNQNQGHGNQNPGTQPNLMDILEGWDKDRPERQRGDDDDDAFEKMAMLLLGNVMAGGQGQQQMMQSSLLSTGGMQGQGQGGNRGGNDKQGGYVQYRPKLTFDDMTKLARIFKMINYYKEKEMEFKKFFEDICIFSYAMDAYYAERNETWNATTDEGVYKLTMEAEDWTHEEKYHYVMKNLRAGKVTYVIEILLRMVGGSCHVGQELEEAKKHVDEVKEKVQEHNMG